MSWVDDLSAGERAELTDAGRLGPSRFDGPPERVDRSHRFTQGLPDPNETCPICGLTALHVALTGDWCKARPEVADG